MRTRKTFLWMAMVISTILLTPLTAWADAYIPTNRQPITKLKNTLVMYDNNTDGASAYRSFSHAKNGVKKLKSSNTKVLYVSTYGTTTSFVVEKPGKSTVTYTYKGKKHKVQVVVKKYVNPIKSVTVGKKTYKKPFKKRGYISSSNWITFKGKQFKVTPENGWKVARIVAQYGSKSKVIKNGGKIPASNSQFCILTVVMQNTKNGGYSEVVYDLWTPID